MGNRQEKIAGGAGPPDFPLPLPLYAPAAQANSDLKPYVQKNQFDIQQESKHKV